MRGEGRGATLRRGPPGADSYYDFHNSYYSERGNPAARSAWGSDEMQRLAPHRTALWRVKRPPRLFIQPCGFADLLLRVEQHHVGLGTDAPRFDKLVSAVRRERSTDQGEEKGDDHDTGDGRMAGDPMRFEVDTPGRIRYPER